MNKANSTESDIKDRSNGLDKLFTEAGWLEDVGRLPTSEECINMYQLGLEIGPPFHSPLQCLEVNLEFEIDVNCQLCNTLEPKLMIKIFHPEPSWSAYPEWIYSQCLRCSPIDLSALVTKKSDLSDNPCDSYC